MVQIGFMIVLYIFNLFSMLNLDFRLVSQNFHFPVFSKLQQPSTVHCLLASYGRESSRKRRGRLNEDGTLFRRSVTNLSYGHAVRYRD